MTTDECPHWADGEHLYVALFGGYVKRCGCGKEVKPRTTEEELLERARKAGEEKPPA